MPEVTLRNDHFHVAALVNQIQDEICSAEFNAAANTVALCARLRISSFRNRGTAPAVASASENRKPSKELPPNHRCNSFCTAGNPPS